MRLIPFIKTHKRILFCAVLATLLIAFVLLSCFVVLEPPEYLDIHISEEIQETQTRNLNILMIWISGLGRTPISMVMVGLSSFFFLMLRLKKEALLVLSTLLSGVLGLGLKILINRPRPPKDLVVLLEETKYQSFPSGHVLFYTVFFGTLILIILYFQKMKSPIKIVLTSICLLMIFLGAVSRVYLGAHWFTDVLGGFILGIFYVLITGYFYIKNERIFLKI
ncbi:MAG: phosphatase PAP2 family protein [Chryseobacterium sp.]|uniref:phosphatase PAP2 family protein n=1 Tax=Chryseobacterium sp. TaxID=1871047 RepID=UPI0025C47E6F|nr:phosphatase PAP2 family protein [Chryseobacterium sp.]MCJ7936297.1 phosphatase PAP2 family protein [Chryseobacterium sp.]